MKSITIEEMINLTKDNLRIKLLEPLTNNNGAILLRENNYINNYIPKLEVRSDLNYFQSYKVMYG